MVMPKIAKEIKKHIGYVILDGISRLVSTKCIAIPEKAGPNSANKIGYSLDLSKTK
jgi:hypothetical protein